MPMIVQNKRNKIKLIKDLKYGKANLRQSLLDIDQIQDLNKIFKNKREQYNIQDMDVVIQKHSTEENCEDLPDYLSPIQRIALYRKEKMNKKIKEKMTKIFQEKPKNGMKFRKPKTEKMLEAFQQKYRNQMPISCKEELKQSQMNLNKIKKNEKLKIQIFSRTKHQKPLYLSRMHSDKASKKTQDVIENQTVMQENPRKRFMSLKTSLPQKQKSQYISVRQIVQGRNRQESKKKVIDIKSIENQLDAYLNKNIMFKKIYTKTALKIDNSFNNQNQKNRSQMIMQKSKQSASNQLNHNSFRTASQYSTNNRTRARSNIQKSFLKSEESSKRIIETMGDFYHSKHTKKNSYNQMVQNIKYDRPLTSSIRRKNYTILNKQSMSPIKQYRLHSEAERQQIMQKNIQFYRSLLQGLQSYHQQDIPTTIYIIEEVKNILQYQYIFTKDILKQLISNVTNMDIDIRTGETLDKIGQFVGCQVEIKF